METTMTDTVITALITVAGGIIIELIRRGAPKR
jgi:hypothetical protein